MLSTRMQSITGTWQLVHTECIAEDGTALSPPYGGAEHCMGLLSLREDGRMICVLCDSRKSMPAGQAREYNSYCGTYHFDGKQLTTRVDATADPAFLGTDQIRDISFDNDIMILRPIRNNGPVSDGQRELHWIRQPDAIAL